jgi:16S rRNA (cytosine967-C5)-methyltransferase
VDDATARLRTVPWPALRGLAPALEAPLAAILAGTPAERVLDRFLRARRDLSREARAAVAEALFGVGLWRRRLAWHAGADASPRLLLASLVRDLAGVADAEELAGLAPGTLAARRRPPDALAVRWSFPDWLAEILVREAGAEAPRLADALDRPGPVCLRANLLRTSRDALAERLLRDGVATRPGRLAPASLVVESARPNLLALAAFREGLLEVQDEASQLVAALVGARPGDAVLDACAGAGGKTLALAADVGRSGRVHAVDPDAERLARLRVRAARAGVGEIVAVEGAKAPAELRVDRALVDAPCSELGALRRGPDLRWRLEPAAFAPLPALQLGILEAAAARVRAGGRLVYATCTFRREEDEEVAAAFEAAHPQWRRIAPAADGAVVTPGGFVRTWPHRDGADGFFAAVWQRA